MKTTSIKRLSGVLLLALAGATASEQAPVIASLGQNGLLVCTNLPPGSTASVEWAPSVEGPWTNTWTGLAAVAADSNGVIRVSVPMFYRLRGEFAAPSNMVWIPAGTFTMGSPPDEPAGYSWEGPQTAVTTTRICLHWWRLCARVRLSALCSRTSTLNCGSKRWHNARPKTVRGRGGTKFSSFYTTLASHEFFGRANDRPLRP